MRYFLILFCRDLSEYFLRKLIFLKFLFTFFSLLLMFVIVRNMSIDIGMMTVIYAITVIAQGQIIFQQDSDENILMHQTISGCPAYIIVLAKFCVVYVMQISCGFVLALLFYLFSVVSDLSSVFEILGVLAIIAVPIAAILVFSSAVAVAVKGNIYINALIAGPSILLSLFILSAGLDLTATFNSFGGMSANYLGIMTIVLFFSGVIYLCACSYLVSKIQS